MGDRKLILVDGSGYLYRAFHALPPLTNSRGEPTGAVLGVLNMINKMIKDEAPDRLAVVFDAPGRTFRDDLFDQYKAHRAPMPDDLRSQVQPLYDTVEAMGLPLLRVTGVEADDVIGTLARQGADAGFKVLISTGDKDMAQLVGPNIELINTMSNSRLNRDSVKAKFDVFPEQIVDYLALVGDSSDNIPGVTSVGPKTAAKWLNQYQTLDALVAHAAEIAGKVGENLRNELSVLELSRKLATIDSSLQLELSVEQLVSGVPNVPRLRELYTRLELRSLLRALGPESAPADTADAVAVEVVVAGVDASGDTAIVAATAIVAPARPREYHKVMSEDVFEQWLEKLKAAPLISFDTETDSLDYMQARVVGVAFAVSPGEAAYVPLRRISWTATRSWRPSSPFWKMPPRPSLAIT
jgi:DNA polymerase-1